MLAICGRGRKEQYALAEKFGITGFSTPAGGCLLTDKNFSARMLDTLEHGYRNFRETIALKWGRHFRINNKFKAVLGRDQDENENLERFAHRDDMILSFIDRPGGVLILKGDNPPQEILETAAGLIQYYSKFKNDAALKVYYRKAFEKEFNCSVIVGKLDSSYIGQIKI